MPYNVDFQNDERVKSWSLPECSKRFLFAIDSSRLEPKIQYIKTTYVLDLGIDHRNPIKITVKIKIC